MSLLSVTLYFGLTFQYPVVFLLFWFGTLPGPRESGPEPKFLVSSKPKYSCFLRTEPLLNRLRLYV